MKKIIFAALMLLVPALSSAHVSVKPGEVGLGAYQTFNVSVPTEKEIDTVEVRLVIPEGLASVRPNVKPGWEVEIIKTGEGEDARVSEIVWSGGAIPQDQRDDFYFSAKTPAVPATLIWKAHQTYSDGTVVSWAFSEEEQAASAHGEEMGPYSETVVFDDLAAEETEEPVPVVPAAAPIKEEPEGPGYFVLLSLIISGSALALSIANIPRRTVQTKKI